MLSRCFAAALLAALCLGCDENLADIAGPTPNLTPTLSSIEQEIFNTTDSAGRAACTNCHSDAGGRVPPVGMVLLPGRSYDFIVNVPARGRAGAIRVIPGDPENSYLIDKLENTQSAAGGSGSRMPKGGAALSTDEIQAIRDWITTGAQNN